MTGGSVLVASPPDASYEQVRSMAGVDADRASVYRWASADPTPYGYLVVGADVARVAAPHLAYRPRGVPMWQDDRPDAGHASVFVVANNVLGGRDAEFDDWYRNVHIPHTFEYFGFSAARLFSALDRSSPFQRLVVYACPDDHEAVTARITWAATDRERAARQGREPLLPVSETVVPPRHAGFYTPCA